MENGSCRNTGCTRVQKNIAGGKIAICLMDICGGFIASFFKHKARDRIELIQSYIEPMFEV